MFRDHTLLHGDRLSRLKQILSMSMIYWSSVGTTVVFRCEHKRGKCVVCSVDAPQPWHTFATEQGKWIFMVLQQHTSSCPTLQNIFFQSAVSENLNHDEVQRDHIWSCCRNILICSQHFECRATSFHSHSRVSYLRGVSEKSWICI